MGSINKEESTNSSVLHQPELGLGVCLFPKISHIETSNENLEAVEFDGCLARELANSGLNIQRLLFTAWAIVLSRYVEADIIRFGVGVDPPLREENSTSIAGHVCNVEVDPKATASSLFLAESCSLCLSPIDEANPEAVNTGVFIRQGPGDEAKLYDVNLVAQFDGPRLALKLVYRQRQFSDFHARNLTNTVSHALQIILDDPNQRIGEMSLCCVTQKKRILSWQNQSEQLCRHQAVFRLLEEHAAHQPHAQAVEDLETSLTYRELDELSSRVAVFLQNQYRVRNGSMVMLCTTKTRWTIVAMLAINKAGGCFVPCDPDHPESRRRAMATACKAQLAITSPEYKHLFSEIVEQATVIAAEMVQELPRERLKPVFHSNPEAPAYCFFTSGSTGDPKGCLGSHSALAAVSHQVPSLRLTPDSRVLQFAKLGFGISFIEIFCTLSAGGTVCILSEQERMNALPEAINRMRVNWALLTPTVAESLHPEELPTFKTLFLGGETPSEAQVVKWMSSVALFQVYGTTEMAGVTMVSQQQITSLRDRRTVGVPSNSRVWLADADNHDRLAPIGAVAELIIEGPSLAEGYLGNPERSKASFITSAPWLDEGDSDTSRPRLLYITGDLVRYNEDGSVSLVGRKGTRVKLRGQRLELEGVECQLARLLRDSRLLLKAQRVVAAVINPLGVADEGVLVAVVVVPEQKNPTSRSGLQFLEMDAPAVAELKDIQQNLHLHLPSFMVPQLLLTLTELPRGATGKVDRRILQRQLNELPYEELRRLAGLTVETQDPKSESERVIHSLVCDTLRLSPDKVGMRDDFFHLGGNSMSAIKLVAAAKRQSLRLVVADIFAHPTLAELAAFAGSQTTSSSCVSAVQKPFALLKSDQLDDDMKETIASQLNIDASLVQDAYPCTPLQEGLMALTEKSPSSYRCRVFCHLKRDVQIDAFKAAWVSVVQRNDILRTRLILTPSRDMMQVVLREPFPWDTADDRESYLASSDEAPMGLGTSLVHGSILTNDPDGAVFVLTIHHVLCDRWSIRLLLEQVQSVYQGSTVKQRPNTFSPFVKYIESRASQFDEYWKKQFTSLEAQIFPPLPQSQFTPVSNEEVRHEIRVPLRIARSYTLSTYIRLAWALVIAHNTAVDDVVFGETLSGRNAKMDQDYADDDDTEQIVGPTIASVPQRIRIDPRQTAAEALAQVQEQGIQMVPYEQAGLQRIRRVAPEAEIACLFQSHLVIQPPWNAPDDIFRAVEAGSVSIGGFLSYALALECSLSEDESQLTIIAGFDPRVLSPARVQRLLSHWDVILQSLILEPYRVLSDVPRVGLADVEQIRAWNIQVAKPSRETIHEVIRLQAQKSPSAQAICSWDGEFSYAEVDHRSTQVAVELLYLGIKPIHYIGILFEKSKWTTVAMLGVNKAGGAFVLMDPAQPRQRLCTIAKEAQLTTILCSATTRELAGQIVSPSQVVLVTEEANIWTRAVDCHKLPRVHPEDAAYAVFTSGSTGTPKGTIIEHGSFCTSAQEFTSCQLVDSNARMLQFAAYSFDACIGESLSTLMVGGCVCVVSDHDRQNALARAASDSGVTHAMLTPSVARLLRHEEIPSLKVLSLMGEAMRPADYAYWSERVVLINGYGPTECSVGISYQRYEPGVHVRDIGRPRAAVAWIVDPRDHHRLMPVGAVGELLLEGDPVARGYINNAEQTQKSFIEAPVWLKTLRRKPYRIYKTGDLVHYNEDGSLRFVGRASDQIKLRGQRLERGEVETQLRECWEWQRASEAGEVAVDAVMPLGNPDRVCLAAFVVVQEKEATSTTTSLWLTPDEGFMHLANQAETRLQQDLPHFMVPSMFVPVSRMPRMASGKIDRGLLRRHIESLSTDELQSLHPGSVSPRMPSSPEEQLLQDLWALVLGIPAEHIGVDDNFFRLGGDSIAGMQVVVQARSRQKNYSLADIFTYKTIAALVENAGRARAQSSLSSGNMVKESPAVQSREKTSKKPETLMFTSCPIESQISRKVIEGIEGIEDIKDIEDIYPCAPIQRGMLLVHARRPAFYHVAFTWEMLDMSLETVDSAVQQVIARYPIFRSFFLEPQPAFASFMQVVRRHQPQDILVRSASEREAFPGDFQPSLEVPSRFTIYKEEKRVWVRLDITHALWDGITSLVVERDLVLACRNQLKIRDPPAARFGDYISYTHDQDIVTAGVMFWKDHLAQFEPCYFPSLSRRLYPNGKADDDTSHCMRFEISDHSAIGPYCKRNNITAANIFCLAWALVLQSFVGSENVCFGSLVSGRDIPLEGIAEMAGPLINCLPFHVDLSQGSISNVLQRVYSDYAASVSHQTCSIADLPHHSKQSPMALFNTQLSIRHHVVGDLETQSGIRLSSIQSPEPQERRVSLYVIMEEQRTRVELWYWASTMSAEQASIVQACFCQAVSQILRHPEADVTGLELLSQAQKESIWGQPSSTRESEMRQIWAQVLNRTPDGITSDGDFFSLGGDSISAMKVVALARKNDMRVRLADFFADSRLRAVVQRVQEAESKI